MHNSKSRIVRTRTVLINVAVLVVVLVGAFLLIPDATETDPEHGRSSASASGSPGN